ncbi:uncharacterized protein LOC103710918 [Phoenix dactylifera]|uniref:Uncharacterized protein LOC103710918 n=1 Tax=Phoenix dactylifera TaxID=42345 RepID=A0A8B9AGV2_PHODC|nr:uncharacterized protein LOC103710918 [Phoenix dactylifera]XP_026661979.2 uncharacterized protein LOC103710918 [Phoenix dactylifera]XP_038985022.1 uncharacterized protein LOC103710918 [Phoenix dactylifera]XP_038985023.1 uncharacterized protein LOC103710918 [Phoenix dactylifera]XP_038985024.1 uncharacterized protein LOC103710918 [Phoenix dactylifera]XP_038985025.1 uncharacterized protein LOC103710918 [Phoenix dactylifera]
MPQGNLRSAVHRSLTKSLPVGFEVGNETVQWGTSRRSKTSQSVALEPIERRGRRGSDLMPFRVKEEEKVMAYQEDSELQLLHVSKGAQKLDRMIDSWSKAPNLDGRSKHFAEDLLRSALDLQESLVMLEKLQNASKIMARMNKKQKPEFIYEREQELEQENSSETLGSKTFEGGGCHHWLQEPWLSIDGSSRNLVEELKQVIGDSLCRQNLLSLSSDDKKASSSKTLGYSQSKVANYKHSEQEVEAVGSIRASDQPKKPKARNLIAKLMGLEEVPSQTAQPVKKEEKGKNINSPRHSLDIEMPKARKLLFIPQIPDPKRKTLQEIIETMQFKGLLKSLQAEHRRCQPCFSDTPQLQQYARDFYGDDDVPPIVIMKPLHLPCWERGEIHKEPTLEKVAVKEDIRSTKLGQEEKVSDQKNMVTGTAERKKMKPKGKIKEKSFPNVKSVSVASSCRSQQKKEAFETRKKSDKEQKELFLNEKKQEEKKDFKATKVLISPSKTSTAAAKHDKRLAAARNNGSTQISTSQNQNLKCSSKSVAQNFSGSTKKKKTTGAKPIRSSSKEVKCKEDDKEVNSHNKTDSLSTTRSTFSGEELSEQADQDTEPCNRDDTVKSWKELCEVIGKINQDGNISGSGEEDIQLPEKKATTGEAAAIEDDLKLLLLGNQPFINRARELFNVDDNRPSYHQIKGTDEVGKRNAKLFLDIAAELMMRKSHQRKHLIHSSLQTHLWGRTVYYTMDLLVDEISNEISKLTNYSIVNDDAATDSLYRRLERDLKCKDPMINALWDSGWVDWICMEETDQVVDEVGEYVLASLIEEAAIELIY